MSHVLIIESEPWLGDHYQRTFERQGYSIGRATNALTAIDMIDDTPPAAIVMSLMLDGPSAIGLLHELQSYVDTAAIPIIVCTSLSRITEEELLPYGVYRLIDSTTMRPEDVVAAVRSALYKEYEG